MAGDLKFGTLADTENHQQVADGDHVGVGLPGYAELAPRLLDNGYAPLPLVPATKKPAVKHWPSLAIDDRQVADWAVRYPKAGVGLRTGDLVAIDIDLLDPDAAHAVADRAIKKFGDTLMRVGRWPKRLLIYRTLVPIRKLGVPGVEILCLGQQFVAFGIHPDTRRAYEWVTGESPCEVLLDALPFVDEAGLQLFLAEAAGLSAHLAAPRRGRSGRQAEAGPGDALTRNAAGLVIDGRDGWLSRIAFHTVHDAADAGETLDPRALADRAGNRLAATTDLSCARKDGRRGWCFGDAQRKVADKLALLAAGRLPARDIDPPVPEPLGELLAPDEARAQLGEVIDGALAAATAWWASDRSGDRPAVGIRATVGLGKSAVSRGRIAAWQRDMAAAGLPQRVLVATSSHALAEEAAAGWRAVTDAPVAVLRGYERKDPTTGAPMCRDVEMVKLALRENLGIGQSVCRRSETWSCPHFDGCLKQQNKRDVADVAIVLAPYDVLFTGPAAGPEPLGLLVIDEGCWQRAQDNLTGLSLESFASVNLTAGPAVDDPDTAARMADLLSLRLLATKAFASNAGDVVKAPAIRAAGLTAEDCLKAIGLEEYCRQEVAIFPGMSAWARHTATAAVRQNEVVRQIVKVWTALSAILQEDAQAPALRVAPPSEKSGLHHVNLHNHRNLVPQLAGVPILHLDATLRPELAGRILPGLDLVRIEAAQPHQHVTLVTGKFAKTNLCPEARLSREERLRRKNRLREMVDHVRWRARRVAPGGVLVVTYMAIEAEFAGIPGVKTAHFNATAGLDQFRDVALLIVIGRPLPSSDEPRSPVRQPVRASAGGALPAGASGRAPPRPSTGRGPDPLASRSAGGAAARRCLR